MENSNHGSDMPKNDWLNANSQNDENEMIMPGTAGNISSPTDQYTGNEFQNSDRQDDPGNARENEDDDLEEENDMDEEDTDEDDSLHKSDWGDIDPQHDGRSSSNDPSFPGSAI